MGLTSVGFVGLLIIAAVGALAAGVWFLPRYAAPGARSLLGRVALVLGGQALLALALLALVNSSMGFYSSWTDLFGKTKGAVRVADHRAVRNTKAPSLHPSRNTLTKSLPAKDGRLDAVQIKGPRSGLVSPAYVYVPPQYGQAVLRHQRLPVVLVLSDRAGIDETIVRLRLPQVAAAQIAAGRMQPSLIVFSALPGSCVDSPGGAQAETFLTQDLPADVASTYHATTGAGGWAVLGRGPGASCAATLPLRNPDRFAAGALPGSGLTAPAGNLYGGNPAIRDEYDPFWRVQHRTAPPVGLLVAQPAGDVRARQFGSNVKPPTRVDPLTMPVDTVRGWQRDLPAILQWLNSHLTPENRP